MLSTRPGDFFLFHVTTVTVLKEQQRIAASMHSTFAIQAGVHVPTLSTMLARLPADLPPARPRVCTSFPVALGCAKTFDSGLTVAGKNEMDQRGTCIVVCTDFTEEEMAADPKARLLLKKKPLSPPPQSHLPLSGGPEGTVTGHAHLLQTALDEARQMLVYNAWDLVNVRAFFALSQAELRVFTQRWPDLCTVGPREACLPRHPRLRLLQSVELINLTLGPSQILPNVLRACGLGEAEEGVRRRKGGGGRCAVVYAALLCVIVCARPMYMANWRRQAASHSLPPPLPPSRSVPPHTHTHTIPLRWIEQEGQSEICFNISHCAFSPHLTCPRTMDPFCMGDRSFTSGVPRARAPTICPFCSAAELPMSLTSASQPSANRRASLPLPPLDAHGAWGPHARGIRATKGQPPSRLSESPSPTRRVPSTRCARSCSEVLLG